MFEVLIRYRRIPESECVNNPKDLKSPIVKIFIRKTTNYRRRVPGKNIITLRRCSRSIVLSTPVLSRRSWPEQEKETRLLRRYAHPVQPVQVQVQVDRPEQSRPVRRRRRPVRFDAGPGAIDIRGRRQKLVRAVHR